MDIIKDGFSISCAERLFVMSRLHWKYFELTASHFMNSICIITEVALDSGRQQSICGEQCLSSSLVFLLGQQLTCVTLSVTLCVRSLTLGAMMVFSEDGGEGHFLSLLVSEKLRVIRGILLMVLYLLRLESEVEPSKLDLIWLRGPEKGSNTGRMP